MMTLVAVYSQVRWKELRYYKKEPITGKFNVSCMITSNLKTVNSA